MHLSTENIEREVTTVVEDVLLQMDMRTANKLLTILEDIAADRRGIPSDRLVCSHLVDCLRTTVVKSYVVDKGFK